MSAAPQGPTHREEVAHATMRDAAVDHHAQASPGDARRLPLAAGPLSRTIAFQGRRRIALDTFLAEVRGVAETLPDAACAVNLCEDRYRFLVAFCAVALRGQINLLPPSRAPAAVAEVLTLHPDSYCLSDTMPAPAPPRLHVLPEPLPRRDGPMPLVAADAVAMIGFTSGSTGTPTANPKTWDSLHASTRQNAEALAHLLPAGGEARIVATVPPQHMYGMELSVLQPLLTASAVHGGRPFFPDDIARALRDADDRAWLVTTPVHLRALVESGVELPPMAGVVTATAPLPQTLATQAEDLTGCELRELFGSTETCVIAHRRTACEDAWTCMPGVELESDEDGTRVHARHLAAPVGLADRIERLADGRFLLRGRQADLLEIAGKRASLGDLTRRLLAIPGVVDGVMLQLDPDDAGVRRIAALAVAPTLGEADILDALRHAIDPVFLPRRLRLVDALPRNETGKLPRAELLRVLRQGRETQAGED